MTFAFPQTANWFVPVQYGFETLHPWIVTDFFVVGGATGATGSVTTATFTASVTLNVAESAVQLTNDGSGGL